jgi:hypothetical protein
MFLCTNTEAAAPPGCLTTFLLNFYPFRCLLHAAPLEREGTVIPGKFCALPPGIAAFLQQCAGNKRREGR